MLREIESGHANEAIVALGDRPWKAVALPAEPLRPQVHTAGSKG